MFRYGAWLVRHKKRCVRTRELRIILHLQGQYPAGDAAALQCFVYSMYVYAHVRYQTIKH